MLEWCNSRKHKHCVADVLAGTMGGKGLCWVGGLPLSFICRMSEMMVCLSTEEAGGTEEEEDDEGSAPLVGG